MPEKPRSERDWHTLIADQVARHGKLFFQTAYGLLRDDLAVEDVCQQALLKALSKPIDARGDRVLRAWLVKVVINESLVEGRRREFEQRTLVGPDYYPDVAVDDAANCERRLAVLEALEKLAEPVRAIVVMRLLDGMTGREVADALDCSEAQVSNQLHVGMAILRIALKDWKSVFANRTKVR